ncbi:MAG TPA: FecR domain-containing protein [Pricia sp.]|nr:FecR domain-containing protein [Pricia sp.]
MTAKEVDKLIQKYIDGRATPEEIASLEKLEKGAEPEILKNLFKNRDEEKKVRDAIFDSINIRIKGTPKPVWWKYASAAAILIGCLASGYFFRQHHEPKDPVQLPSDAITLQLGDGSIEVLSEDETTKVVDRSGKMVGVQKGAQITYGHTNDVKELVYNTLTIPYGKRFELRLSDGTQVHLNSGTSIRYPVTFLKGRQRRVFLNGEAFFGVTKDSLHPFVVRADGIDVRVLGTRFNVSSYPEDNRTDVVLVEGSVGMNAPTEPFDGKSGTILEPGFKGTFDKQNGKISKEPVVTHIYTSWMDGELVFRNLTFENILRKLERHYNVSISNNNAGLAKEIFNASFGNVTLKKVLEDLKLTYGIDYSIDQNKVIIN